MVSRTRSVAVATVLLSGTLSACEPNRFVSGWVPYWGGADGRVTINDPDAALLLSDVSMLWYQTDDDGTVDSYGSNTSLQSTVDAARAHGLAVIPAIFDSQPAGVMSAMLADPVRRAGHVQAIVQLVTAQGYDGIDLDYEVFAFGHPKAQWPAITTNWVVFVEQLANELHARGKLLSVTVPPVWNNGSSGYTVYAQQQIAPFVDRLRLMVYDWSISSPGPIAPMFWVNSVIAYSSSRVPGSKLQLGVPAYGRHWTTQKISNEVCPDGAIAPTDSIEMTETAALAAAHNVTPSRHADGELTFGWTQQVTGPRTKPIVPPVWNPPPNVAPSVDAPATGSPLQPAQRIIPPTIVTCTVQHTVIVPDAVAVQQRAQAALTAGWSGIIVFALGYELVDMYDTLENIAPQRPNGAVTGSLATPITAGNMVRITGQALNPEFDLPAPVRLTITPTAGGTVVVSTVLARAEIGGMPPGAGPFHGIDEVYALASGDYTVCGSVLQWGGAVAADAGCVPFTVNGSI